jgi:hypothetical protein
MLCEHLRALDEAIALAGIGESFRGEAWSKACREWVYYECVLDREAIRRRFSLAPCVVDHDHYGTHDGQEEGLVCAEHRDGIMGLPRKLREALDARLFPSGGTA